MTSTTTRCPDLGAWRAWLDREPVDANGAADTQSDHLAACSACRATVGELSGNAALAATALGSLGANARPEPTRVEQARLRLARREPDAADCSSEPRREEMTPTMTRTRAMTARRWRIALSGLAAGIVLTFLVGTDAGQTATAAFLGQFRAQRFAVVTVDRAQVAQLRGLGGPLQLERLGTVKGGPGTTAPEPVATVAQASQKVGFPVRQPDPATLPTGLDPAPTIVTMPGGEVRFTLDRAKALAYLQEIGRTDIRVPEKLDGDTLVVSLPAAAALAYAAPGAAGPGASKTFAAPGLLIGQTREISAGVEGEGSATLEELRELLLNVPGLPPDTVRQLRAIGNWQNTVPIFVDDPVDARQTTIGGGEGVLIKSKAGDCCDAVWQREGRIYAVRLRGVAADEARVRRLADSLR